MGLVKLVPHMCLTISNKTLPYELHSLPFLPLFCSV